MQYAIFFVWIKKIWTSLVRILEVLFIDPYIKCTPSLIRMNSLIRANIFDRNTSVRISEGLL